MYGNIGGYNQSVADQMAQMGAGFQDVNQTARQNALNYRGALLGQQAQNTASNAAMTGAYAQAAGSALGGISGSPPTSLGKASKIGTNPAGEYQYSMNAVPRAIAV